MLLEVFDKPTRTRQGFVQTYSFVQYTDRITEIGSFEMSVPYTEESLKYLQNGSYILFEEDVMGIVRYVSRITDGSTTVTIRGHLINSVMANRSFLKTSVYAGDANVVARQMVSDLLIANEDARRNVSFVTLSDDPKHSPTLPSVNLQNTGGKLSDVIGNMLATIQCGYEMVPKISKYDLSSDTPTNVEAFEFRVLKPANRTIGNADGNDPVEFSFALNNLATYMYEQDDMLFCSTAIVAGEGEGQNRTVVETGDLLASGIDRIELYVDARDLQTETETSTIPLEQYEAMLKQRGNEYLEEHKSFTSINGTIVSGNIQHTYKKDFFKGDLVSVVDTELGVSVDVQITAVTKSATQAGEFLDITFGYERSSVREIMRKRGVL